MLTGQVFVFGTKFPTRYLSSGKGGAFGEQDEGTNVHATRKRKRKTVITVRERTWT
jgi:hypothetical protein